MHLIEVETLRLRHVVSECPPYAILSHTWCDDEVTFSDFTSLGKENGRRKAGYRKIELTCDQAKRHNIKYAWIDTCCINKDSSAELSEAINSMYKWYKNAEICYAFIEDILFPGDGKSPDTSSLRKCKWFSRGWTLQELLAPSEVVFYGPDWVEFGRKTEVYDSLHDITGVPEDVLRKERSFEEVSVAARMSWAAGRETTRQEDLAYCLMGIFDVNMPLLYGEGDKAFVRLQEQIMSQVHDDSLFAWCCDDDTARQFPYRGLLASSPGDFRGCADVITFGADDAGTTHMLGNGKVSLRCSVHKDRDKTLLGLRCFRGDVTRALHIEVIQIGLNSYIRVNPSRLVACSSRSSHEVVIEKYTARVYGAQVDDVHLRDAVFLGDLPRGISLKAVHSDGTFDRLQTRFSVVDTIDKKVAFELEISKEVSGEYTPHLGSGKDARFLLLFWVKQQGLRSYIYYFDIISPPLETSQQQFAEAVRPQDVHTTREFRIGWISVHISVARRKVQGADMLYLDLQIKKDEGLRNQMLSESAELVAADRARIAADRARITADEARKAERERFRIEAEAKTRLLEKDEKRAGEWVKVLSIYFFVGLPFVLIAAFIVGHDTRPAFGFVIGGVFLAVLGVLCVVPMGRGRRGFLWYRIGR